MRTRHLAAVMFTDIEGYTRLMQTDESAAILLRDRHREVFEAAHQKFNGKIIQYFGDGTLSIFKSSRDAVECAIEMQTAFRDTPKVPLRIGIHLGEILVAGDDIAGDTVNVASRVESLGVSGSIFISAKVFDDIKNQKGIKTESMGFFEFKNVDKPKEVYAIANSGLIVPDPESLTGKTKSKDFRKETDRNFIKVLKDLWYRKVFLVAGVYLLGLWALVKGADLFISNYAISPYWSDVLLVFFISFLPSVILHSYYHNKLEINRLRLVEKITIPSNGMLSIALLVFIFGSKDLGATSQTVVSKDEFGNKIEKQIVKDEFRKKINFYPFTNETSDSTLDWLEPGLTTMIGHDLVQDDYTWCNTYFGYKNLGAMQKHAESRNTPNFVTGKFEKRDSLYIVTSQLYESKNGKLIQERTLNGQNLFDLSDEIAVQIKKDIGVPDYRIQNDKDLPVSSILTDNIEAYRFYIQALNTSDFERFTNHIKADKLDPSFSINNYSYASNLIRVNVNRKEAISAIEKAMKHRSKASDIYNMRIRALNYNLHDQPEKAIALGEMQAELNPEDSDAYNRLISEYSKNGYYEKSLEACRKLYNLFPELTQLKLMQARLLNILNRPEEALEIMEPYVKRFPTNTFGFQQLADIHLALGNLDEAENYFNRVSLMNPDHKGFASMLDHIQYLKEKGKDTQPEMLEQFVGEYKWAGAEVSSTFIYLNGKLYEKPENWSNTVQAYPINDTTLVYNLGSFKKRFLRNKTGVYDKYIREFRSGKTTAYKLDVYIKKAEKLFSEGKDEAALKAYEEAYTKNPNHHFLNNYIQHLNFKKRKETKSTISLWQSSVGKYQDYGTITLEDNELYWWDVEGGFKRQLLPINEKEFVLFEKWVTKMVLVEKEGKVIGVDWISPSGYLESLTKVD